MNKAPIATLYCLAQQRVALRPQDINLACFGNGLVDLEILGEVLFGKATCQQSTTTKDAGAGSAQGVNHRQQPATWQRTVAMNAPFSRNSAVNACRSMIAAMRASRHGTVWMAA